MWKKSLCCDDNDQHYEGEHESRRVFTAEGATINWNAQRTTGGLEAS